jgi:integrase
MKRTRLPKYVTRFVDRHGKPRYRFRKKGQAARYFQAEFNTPEFEAEYDACLKGVAAPKIEVGQGRIKPGTVADLVRRYYAAPEFTGLADSTKATYRNQLNRFIELHGSKPVRLMERRHIKAIIGAMSDRPGAANSLLARLKLLMKFAIEEGLRRDNPALGVKGFRTGNDGFHSWTDDEIAKFEATHAIGTRARLAMALLLNTGQRRSDVVRMGHQHVSKGRIQVKQQKTGAHLWIPVHPDLVAIIAATPRDNLTFVTTAQGKPFSAAGFGNWFRECCDEAGLPQCSAHGLRKAAARRLAEAGCSNQQIKSITGHQTEAEVARYTRAAEQEVMAKQAMKALSKGRKKGTTVANPKRKVRQNDR